MALKQLFVLFCARNNPLKNAKNLSTKSGMARNISFGGYALLAVPITTFCLGTWQVKRRAWKLNLIDEVKKKNQEPPVEFPEQLQELSDMEYRRVRMRGTFDHSKEVYIGPRSLMSNKEDGGGGVLSSRSQTGVLVITPFHFADKNLTILVNRGWVPKHKKDPSTRPEGQIQNEVELIGTVRHPENRPQFCPKSQPGSDLFFYRDVTRMAQMAGAAPILVDADSSSTVPGGPIGGQTKITFRNEHMSYILTWYSLSIATFYMWYRNYLRSPKVLI
ncbi:surfeit locus protein 1-like [Uloborus diversus]|uniref:surfeit locus protein 1-like n=1 Tax=Uloborus diversus TaxID=327109 RepID=UPI00240A3973|nr:surfeit locus protein 1-like [Uloborus diversus]